MANIILLIQKAESLFGKSCVQWTCVLKCVIRAFMPWLEIVVQITCGFPGAQLQGGWGWHPARGTGDEGLDRREVQDASGIFSSEKREKKNNNLTSVSNMFHDSPTQSMTHFLCQLTASPSSSASCPSGMNHLQKLTSTYQNSLQPPFSSLLETLSSLFNPHFTTPPSAPRFLQVIVAFGIW